MRRLNSEQERWAREEFGGAELGDGRRTDRAVRMAARAAENPGGKISRVFCDDAERQGAYDFLESGHASAAALIKAMAAATAKRASEQSFAFVALDGSSITLTDRVGSKDFGSVGTLSAGARGLKVVNGLACNPNGAPLGLLSQVWWARTDASSQRPKTKCARNRKRKVEEKETKHWIEAIVQAAAHADDAEVRLWFQLDREGDNRHILSTLSKTTHWFTVRSSWDRLIEATGKDKQYLRQWLARQAPGGDYSLNVTEGPHRSARHARIDVRWGRVVLRLRDRWAKTERKLEVTAVWAREEGTCPPDEKPVDWLLLTNRRVDSLEDACFVVRGYTQRWRVEEFHKTWKSGACKVEQSQLRSCHAVVLWATILAAVAARIERLKILARTTPDKPATVEFSSHEIRALIVLMREIKKRNETIPDAPTIGQATNWIARLGGYTGKSSGGPPGSITIRRGLEKLRPAAVVVAALEAQERSDQ
jgi:hypothetical protein